MKHWHQEGSMMTNPAWKPEFSARFRRHEDELRWLYMEAYQNDRQAYDYFTGLLYRRWAARDGALKSLDRAREKAPDWYRGMAGMNVYADAFAGALKGVKDRLDYVSELGANYLHLQHRLDRAGNDCGKGAPSCFQSVWAGPGSMEDLRALAQACHARGILLGLDLVMDRTGDGHEWAVRARQGDRESQNRYFFFDSWAIPGSSAAPGGFSWCGEAGKMVMASVHPRQWDLNYRNPTVFNDMTDQLLSLCGSGADVIRLDGIDRTWKALDVSGQAQPQTHTLARMLRMACDIVCPGVLLLGDGETAFFGTAEKPECHLLRDAAAADTLWHTVATGDTRLLWHQLGRMFALPREYTFLTCLRRPEAMDWRLDFDFLCRFGQGEAAHRQFLNGYFTGAWPGSPSRGTLSGSAVSGSAASLCGVQAARETGDREALITAVRRLLMLHALLFTLNGVPVIASGDEIAQENGPLDWVRAEKRYDQSSPEGTAFSTLRRLLAARAECPVFSRNADVWLLDTNNGQVLGIGRYCQGEQLLALFNFSDECQTAWTLDPREYQDMTTGEITDAGTVLLPPAGFRWLKHVF